MIVKVGWQMESSELVAGGDRSSKSEVRGVVVGVGYQSWGLLEVIVEVGRRS